tara:strand:- start:1607 stop:2617 length:1011 start_codon:yes stop_codon:yes gene_type:complete
MTEGRIPTPAEVINARRVIEGERSELMCVRPVRHQFARDMLKKMRNNHWTEEEAPLGEDQKQWINGDLSEGEQRAYKCVLAALSNLDGIQLNNLTNNINQHITSPEINQCLVRQAWEEAMHVESYAHMIESMGFEPTEVYFMFERDGMLAAKNAAILKQSRILGEDYSAANFVRAVVANIALEGIYFYNGFLLFYTLARMGKMQGSAKMVKFIQRDEVTHLELFVNIWYAIQRERPELFTAELLEDARQILRNAVDMEAEWGAYFVQGGVPGMNDRVCRAHVENLADLRANSIGLGTLYGTRSPVAWFDDYSRVDGTSENFFEGKVTGYLSGALDW